MTDIGAAFTALCVLVGLFVLVRDSVRWHGRERHGRE